VCIVKELDDEQIKNQLDENAMGGSGVRVFKVLRPEIQFFAVPIGSVTYENSKNRPKKGVFLYVVGVGQDPRTAFQSAACVLCVTYSITYVASVA
jgi:hypothetical protein